MKKNISTIIAIISCIAVGVCMFQNARLKRKISNLESNLSSQIMSVDSRISDIYANIDEHLAEQENLLAVREPLWDVEGMDIDTKTATVKYTIVPKEYKQNVTTAILVCNEAEYPMTFEDGKFVATIQVPLFEESRISEVRFVENETVRVQGVDWYISPRYHFFPNVYVNSFSVNPFETKKKDGELVCEYSGEFEVQLDKLDSNTKVQSIYLLPYIDGKEQKRIPLSMNTTSTQNLDGGGYVEEVIEANGELNPTYFYCPVDETFKIPYGSTLDLYIEVVDDNGLRYRVTAYAMEVDKFGNYSGVGSSGEEAGIYSEDGERLY